MADFLHSLLSVALLCSAVDLTVAQTPDLTLSMAGKVVTCAVNNLKLNQSAHYNLSLSVISLATGNHSIFDESEANLTIGGEIDLKFNESLTWKVNGTLKRLELTIPSAMEYAYVGNFTCKAGNLSNLIKKDYMSGYNSGTWELKSGRKLFPGKIIDVEYAARWKFYPPSYTPRFYIGETEVTKHFVVSKKVESVKLLNGKSRNLTTFEVTKSNLLPKHWMHGRTLTYKASDGTNRLPNRIQNATFDVALTMEHIPIQTTQKPRAGLHDAVRRVAIGVPVVVLLMLATALLCWCCSRGGGDDDDDDDRHRQQHWQKDMQYPDGDPRSTHL